MMQYRMHVNFLVHLFVRISLILFRNQTKLHFKSKQNKIAYQGEINIKGHITKTMFIVLI